MHFAVLGPLAVADEAGLPVELSAPRLRVLLAALLLQANAPVSAEALVEAVWDAAPPPAAAQTLRSYVRRLRRALGPTGAGRIEARDPGYLIRVQPAEFDLPEFEAACRRAGVALRRRAWEQAGREAGRAVELWRGEPLLDVPSQVLRDGCVPRLERLRLQALEDRAEAELNLGRHAALVPALRELAAGHPLRERFHAQLMLAVYRAGRQGEALEAYRSARRALAQELGVEPGPELRDLHERMLAGDAALLIPEHPETAARTAPERAPWPHLVGAVPGRALGFQERVEALRLRQALEGTGTAVVGQVLSGLGGVGKTQLAAHHARTAFTDGRLDVLAWVDAASRQTILDGYTRAAVELLGVEPDQYAAQRFLAWLAPAAARPVCRWLVVLDDLSDPADLNGLWPPDSAHGRTVVTTRRRDAALTGPGRRRVEVGVFTPAEAVGALHQALTERDHPAQPPEQIRALAAELGYLPLALSQAAAYIADAGVDVAAYRVLLADRTRALADLLPHPGRGQPDEPPDRGALPDGQAGTVAAAWSLSVERADRLHPQGLARPMLQLIAVLDPHGIPGLVLTGVPALRYLTGNRTAPPDAAAPAAAGAAARRALHLFVRRLTAHRTRQPGATAPAPPGRDRLTAADGAAALRALHRLSLIDHTPHEPTTAVRVHQLVQRVTRETLTPADRDRLARTAADLLLAAWPAIESDAALSRALRANTDALDRAAGEALDTPTIHAVLFRAARSLGEAGQAAAARDHFHRLYARTTRLLGPAHVKTLAVRRNLAIWRGRAGDPAGAITAYTELLPQMLQVFGADHPESLRARSELALWRGRAGDPAGAVAAYTELLPRMRRVLGADHPATLTVRSHLAHFRGKSGDAAGAVAASAEVLSDQLRVLGTDHPTTLTARSNLAHRRGEAGDAAGAVAAYSELLPRMLQILGADHPETLIARSNLALWRGRAGDPAGAVTAYGELLSRMLQVLGADHPMTSTVRSNLAHFRGKSGDAAGAAVASAEALSDRLPVLGAQLPTTGTTHVDLAAITAQQAADYLGSRTVHPTPPAWRTLIQHLREHSAGVPAQALQSPLMLSLLLDAYLPFDPVDELTDLQCFPDRLHIEDHLLARVLPTAYAPRPGCPAPRYTAQQATHWLAHLAAQMNRAGTRDLAWWRIAGWLPPRRVKLTLALRHGLRSGLAIFLVIAVASTIVAGLKPGLVFGLVCGLAFGLVLGLVFGLGAARVAGRIPMAAFDGLPTQYHGLKWRSRVRDSKIPPAIGRKVRLIAGAASLVAGLAAGLMAGLAAGPAAGLMAGLLAGLAAGVAIWPIVWLMSRVTTSLAYALSAPIPEDRMMAPRDSWQSNRRLGLVFRLVYALVLGPVLGLLFGLGSGLVFGLAGGLTIGLVTGLVFTLGIVLGLPISINAVLASAAFTLLHRAGYGPLRMMDFLEDARSRGVLRTAGPVYQFRHARLQDFLAATHLSAPSQPTSPTGCASS